MRGRREGTGLQEIISQQRKINDGPAQRAEQAGPDKHAELADQRELGEKQQRESGDGGEAAREKGLSQPADLVPVILVRFGRRLHVEIKPVVDRHAGEQRADDKHQDVDARKCHGRAHPGPEHGQQHRRREMQRAIRTANKNQRDRHHGEQRKRIHPRELPLNARLARGGEAIHAGVGDVEARKFGAGHGRGLVDGGEHRPLSFLAQWRRGDSRPDARRWTDAGIVGRLHEREAAFHAIKHAGQEQQRIGWHRILKRAAPRASRETGRDALRCRWRAKQ